MSDNPMSEAHVKPNGSDGMYMSRKPLPTPPSSPTDTSEGYFSTRKPLLAPVPKRKPVGVGASNLDLPRIPPRQQRRGSPGPDSSRQSIDRTRLTPPVPPVHGHFTDHLHSYQYITDSDKHPQLVPKPDNPPPEAKTGVSLTLIRRDPGSGAQWNVASIHDPLVHEISSESTADGAMFRAKRSGAPMFIDVSNPGYSKFVHMNHSRPVSRDSMDSFSVESDGSSDGVFRRRLWMDGSKHADHAYTHRSRPSMDETYRPSRSSLQLGARDFQFSSRAAVDRRSKGYRFQSPWGGKCEFLTGVAGRSLKVSFTVLLYELFLYPYRLIVQIS